LNGDCGTTYVFSDWQLFANQSKFDASRWRVSANIERSGDVGAIPHETLEQLKESNQLQLSLQIRFFVLSPLLISKDG
jgi:hypothetical protein